MPLSFFNESVIRIRPGTKTERGSTLFDWTNASTATIGGCSVQPSSTSLSQDGRVLGISDIFTLYMPYNADVIEGDRVQFEGETYTVIGVPKTWKSPTGRVSNKQVQLERWSC
mgnify:CR=1 FL=1